MTLLYTYIRLNHLHALCSEVPNALVDTESGLSLHLLHHHIQSNESAGATDTCTAVDKQWLFLGDGEEFSDVANETDDRHDIVWNSVIRPSSVVELSHYHWSV